MSTKNLAAQFTAAQHAAYAASPYGGRGGSKKLIQDLIDGRPVRLRAAVSRAGLRTKAFAVTEEQHAAITAMARRADMSVGKYITTRLFFERALTIHIDYSLAYELREAAERNDLETSELAALLLEAAYGRSR